MKNKKERNGKSIPGLTISRLSRYLRTVSALEKAGVEMISSQRLAEIEDIQPGQVRKDLSYFGSFGIRGQGYHVPSLRRHITEILGLNHKWDVVLIGASQFGMVLMYSEAFARRNLRVTKIFDRTPELIGKKFRNIMIYDMECLEEELDPKTDNLAIIAVPPPEVQSIIDRLSRIGIKGAVYFAARSVNVPENMVIRNQDVSLELGTLTYHITNRAM